METYDAKKFSLGGATVESVRATSVRDYRLDLRLPFFRAWRPGQFVMLRWGRHLIGRPFAVVDWRAVADGPESILSVWIRRLGAGTEELFGWARPGAEIQVTAPLGNGFADALVRAQRLLLLSGGVGGASILPLALARGERDLWIHGERDLSYLDRELMASPLKPQRLHLESGGNAEGFHPGRITQGLEQLAAADLQGIEAIVACGPSAMLEAVAKTVAAHPQLSALPLTLGLEERMGCGIGICFSCSVWTCHGMKRLCTEGPWFEASEIPHHFTARAGGKSA